MPIPLVIESWIWYGFSTGVVLLRFVARYLNFGSIKQLQIDDFLMAVALGFYTTEMVTMNIVADANTNLVPDGYFEANPLTPQEHSERVYGSKMVVLVEQSQIATIWLIKACLLIMYHRITLNSFRAQNIAVKVLAGYVLFGFVFMEIFYFGVWCRPFKNMWAVPTPDPKQCAAAIDHLISNAVFNLSSDVAMLCIAIPMFARSNLPLQRKLILCGIFSIGIFVIICAALNKYYSFAHPFGSQWTYWYIRECSTAIIVANLPFTWSLARRMCGARSFLGNGPSDQTGDSKFGQSGHHLDSKQAKVKAKIAAVFGQNHYADGNIERSRQKSTSEMSNQPARPRQDSLRHLASQTPSSQRPTLTRGESNSSITGRSGSILGREEQLPLGSWDMGADDELFGFGTRRQISSSQSRRSTEATLKHVYVPFRERRQGSIPDPSAELPQQSQTHNENSNPQQTTTTTAAAIPSSIPETPTDTEPPHWQEELARIEPIKDTPVYPRRRSDDSPV